MTEPELKPCPFCGNADQDSLLIDHLEGTVRRPAYRVVCDYCGASTGHTDWGDHVTAGNTRTPTLADVLAVSEIAELVDAAKEVGRISDRDHVAWHRLATALAALTTAPVDGEKK